MFDSAALACSRTGRVPRAGGHLPKPSYVAPTSCAAAASPWTPRERPSSADLPLGNVSLDALTSWTGEGDSARGTWFRANSLFKVMCHVSPFSGCGNHQNI